MKRSEVNEILNQGDAFIRSFGWHLPPFAHWTPEQFRARRAQSDAILAAGLGWDLTDFGQGDYARQGLFLFTTRNGRPADLQAGRGMCYAEKIMWVRDGQVTPMHRHIVKAEDIINRGGGDLVLKIHGARADGLVCRDNPVTVASDGMSRRIAPNEHLRLKPGESVTLLPGIWHSFWAEGGDALVGEVSTVNDDRTDNVFEAPVGRFARIDEDEEPWRLLVADYAGF